MSGIKVILGGGTVMTGAAFPTSEKIKAMFGVLLAAGVKNIDTAQIYGDSEKLLGEAEAGKHFVLDTKAPGGFKEGSLSSEQLVQGLKESLERLGVDKVDVFYIHAPDNSVPLENWIPGVNTLHQNGSFSRFGLSNFKAEDVQRVHDHCKEKGYVLPSVYQGNYSAVARLQESVLFPTLRKLNISFYAYSPIAGGFLNKSKEDFEGGKGRFDPSTPLGKMYTTMYGKPAYLEALAEWAELAEKAGCEKAEVAYRWVAWNSVLEEKYGDAIIVGASSIDQLLKTLAWVKRGPLKKETCEAVDKVWKTIEHEAPLDNYHSYGKV